MTPLTSLNQGAFLRWAFTAASYLAERQEELDALNVFPVPDGDTGTNLLRTLSAALEMLLADSNGDERSLQSRLDELSRDALLSARGNSGVILSQLIVGLAEGVGLTRIDGSSSAGMGLEAPRRHGVGARAETREDATVGPADLATAMRVAAARAREGVSNPVDGTILTVAQAAADEAVAVAEAGGSLSAVTRAATEASMKALALTTSQLPQLAQAGVVDAGGAGLVVILQALDDVVHRADRRSAPIGEPGVRRTRPLAIPAGWGAGGNGDDRGPADGAAARDQGASGAGGPTLPVAEFEVVYHLLDVPGAQVRELEARLAQLGDSIVVGGGREVDGVRALVTVHVHTREPGAAIEAAYAAGMPTGIRLEALADVVSPSASGTACADGAPSSSLARSSPGRRERAEAPDYHLPRARPRTQDGGLDPATLGILAGATGEGIVSLMREAGAEVITAADGGPGEPKRLLAAAQAAIARTGCSTVLALPGRPEGTVAAQAAAVRANAEGITVVVADTRSPVQALAALAVFDVDAEPESEARRLAALAEAVRCGSVEVAGRGATYATGRARRGDLIAYGEGDVRAVGPDAVAVAKSLVDHLLAPRKSGAPQAGDDDGPELVTLVAGEGHLGLAESLAATIEGDHPDIEVIAIEGGQHDSVLLVGVE